jgi:hypothetical protein
VWSFKIMEVAVSSKNTFCTLEGSSIATSSDYPLSPTSELRLGRRLIHSLFDLLVLIIGEVHAKSRTCLIYAACHRPT